jgi:hypothetical protein
MYAIASSENQKNSIHKICPEQCTHTSSIFLFSYKYCGLDAVAINTCRYSMSLHVRVHVIQDEISSILKGLDHEIELKNMDKNE